MKERLVSYFLTLTNREKTLIFASIFSLMMFMLFINYYVRSSTEETILSDINERIAIYEKILKYGPAYKKMKRKKATMVSSLPNVKINGDLYSYLTSIADSVSMDVAIKELKPEKKGDKVKERIEMEVRRQSIEDVMSLLYAIENRTRKVFIDEIEFKKIYSRKGLLNVRFIVARYNETGVKQ